LRTLFLTATHSVYRLTTKVGPRIEPYMREHAAVNDSPEALGLDLDPCRAVPSLSFRTCRTTR
jgi:gluconolactonase